MSVLTCRCCGRPLDIVPVDVLRQRMRLARRPELIFNNLVRALGLGMTLDALVDIVYASAAYRPEHADQSVRAMIGKIRTAAMPFGWTVSHGNGTGVYHLQPLTELELREVNSRNQRFARLTRYAKKASKK